MGRCGIPWRYPWECGLPMFVSWLSSTCYQSIPIERTQASKGVDTIDVHRTATADTLTATPSEGQCGVDFVLDPNECIQHHGAGLVQVQFVGLHLGLLGGSIGVPAVNLELLDLSGGLLYTPLKLAAGTKLGYWRSSIYSPEYQIQQSHMSGRGSRGGKATLRRRRGATLCEGRPS